MKELFTDDPLKIKVEMDSLVENKVPLICGRRGMVEASKLALVAKSKAGTSDILVLFHPHDPSCGAPTCEFYYHAPGRPLRYFETVRVKKAADFLGLKYPTAIYNVHRRQFPRVFTAGKRQSTVTCAILGRQRLYAGTVEDISLEGAKLLIDIPVKLAVGDALCHLSFVLYSRLSAVYEARVTVHEAKVMWLKADDDEVHALGVQFKLGGKNQDVLSNYIDLRAIEDPQDLVP